MTSVSHAQEIKDITPFLGKYQFMYDEILSGKGVKDRDTFEIRLNDIFLSLQNLDRHNSVALLHFAYEDSSNMLNCWLIDNKGVQSHQELKLEKEYLFELERQNIQNINRDFGLDHKRSGIFGTVKTNYVSNANKKLSDVLFMHDLESQLKSYSTILISPILNLGTIPWYSLRPFDNDYEFVVDHWNVQVLESLNQLLIAPYFNEKLNDWGWDYIQEIFLPNLIDESNNDSIVLHFPMKNPIIIGNPNYDGCKLSQLPGAETEAAYVAQKLNGKLLTDTNASLTNMIFKNQTFKSSFIYVASHGFSSPDDPMNESCLYLSSIDGECTKLTAEDIMKLYKNPMSLVILSACETGKGKVVDGGIIGLSRCFMLNRVRSDYPGREVQKYGAQNVIMSLWNVNDNATKELMKLFIDELCIPSNHFPIAPMRKAILAYRKKDDNPYNWSAFQCMGLMFPTNWHMKLPSQN